MIEILTAYAICDNCRTKIFIGGTAAEWLEFHRTWFEGIVDEYCPACQQIPHIAALVAEEKQITANFRNEPTEQTEYEFPEYIS